MKTIAAVLRAVNTPLVLEEVELGAPRAGELLLKIEAAGVCHSDLSVVDGSRIRPLPMALGHEAAGIVEELGAGVRDVRVGDRVVLAFVPSCGTCAECAGGRPSLCIAGALANGQGHLLHGPPLLRDASGAEIKHHLGCSAFARHAVVARESATVVPSDVPGEIAALFGCAALTGVGAVLETARVRPGQSVAIFGLGGVGLAAVMGAALARAQPIFAIDPVASKRKLALELGATAAYSPEEFVGLSVDFAFEAAGSAAVLEAAFKSLKRGGTAVAIGLPHPSKTLTLPALAFAGEGKALIGSYMGSASPQRDVPRYIALYKSGALPIDKLRTAEMPLSQINEAFASLARGEAVRQILRP
jgi:Zn-dependent alcohol dehydrogenase